jgi:hypothetical protein
MGKFKQKSRPNQHPAPPASQAPQPTSGVLAVPGTPAQATAAIRDLGQEANSLVTDAEIANPPVPPSPPSPTEISPVALWNSVHESKELFDRATARTVDAEARANAREEEARGLMAQVHERELKLTTQRDEQRRAQRELEELRTELNRREKQIVEAEGSLRERRLRRRLVFYNNTARLSQS